MAVYHVKEKETIVPLFAGWQETFIWSCLQNCMGEAYTDNLKNPQSAEIMLGDFCFLAGNVNHELLCNKPANHYSEFIIMIPQNKEWEKAIELMFQKKAFRRMRIRGLFSGRRIYAGIIPVMRTIIQMDWVLLF